jgi:hypothetical protein
MDLSWADDPGLTRGRRTGIEARHYILYTPQQGSRLKFESGNSVHISTGRPPGDGRPTRCRSCKLTRRARRNTPWVETCQIGSVCCMYESALTFTTSKFTSSEIDWDWRMPADDPIETTFTNPRYPQLGSRFGWWQSEFQLQHGSS